MAEGIVLISGQPMHSAVTIRDYRATDDIAQITALLHQAYAELAKAGFKYLATHQSEAVTLERLTSGFPLLAEINGAIVGTLTLYPPSRESRCELYCRSGVYKLGQFAVRPDLQRRGIGLRLYAEAESRARQLGAEELALDTAEGAIHLRQWYERLGFRFADFVSWDETNYRSVVLSKRLKNS